MISEKAFKFLHWRSKWNFHYSTLKTINWYKDVFKEDFYLEIQDHGSIEDRIVNVGILSISKELGIEIIDLT